MDPVLLAHLEKIRKASLCPQIEDTRLRIAFSAADALDYLGKKIDEDKAAQS